MSDPRFNARKAMEDDIEFVILEDIQTSTTLKIVPELGNNAYSLVKHGWEYLWFPYASLKEFRDRSGLCGIPLLAPWANRLDGDYLLINDHRYQLRDLGNISRDQNNLPIHGLYPFVQWAVKHIEATHEHARVICIYEPWKDPIMMGQFPLAHTLEMVYTLSGEGICVGITIENLSGQSMPVSVGFHPYFQIPRSIRDTWTISIPAEESVLLSDKLLPTAGRVPNPYRQPRKIGDDTLDHVYTDLDAIDGKPWLYEFRVSAEDRQITVGFDKHFPVAVVYAPKSPDVICFEPMSALTNAINMYAREQISDLPFVSPGDKWHGNFWINL